MHPAMGCVSCDYLIPGCSTCSEVNWNSGITLDWARMFGPDSGQEKYLSCANCEQDERFVEIELEAAFASENKAALPDKAKTTTPVKCESCSTRFDGCSSCGQFGDTCTKCYPTHVLEAVDADKKIPCTRCDYFMSGCLTCWSRSSCNMTKPRRLF